MRVLLNTLLILCASTLVQGGLRVCTTISAPFVVTCDSVNGPTGFSKDLWEQVAATSSNLQPFTYSCLPSMDAVNSAAVAGQCDIVIGNVLIAPNAAWDYTVPIMSNGLSVVTLSSPPPPPWTRPFAFFEMLGWDLWVCLLGCLIATGVLVALFEQGRSRPSSQQLVHNGPLGSSPSHVSNATSPSTTSVTTTNAPTHHLPHHHRTQTTPPSASTSSSRVSKTASLPGDMISRIFSTAEALFSTPTPAPPPHTYPSRFLAIMWGGVGCVVFAVYIAHLVTERVTALNLNRNGLLNLAQLGSGWSVGTTNAWQSGVGSMGGSVVSVGAGQEQQLVTMLSEGLVQALVLPLPLALSLIQSACSMQVFPLSPTPSLSANPTFNANVAIGVVGTGGAAVRQSINTAILQLQSQGGLDALASPLFVPAVCPVSTTVPVFHAYDIRGMFYLYAAGGGAAVLAVLLYALISRGSWAMALTQMSDDRKVITVRPRGADGFSIGQAEVSAAIEVGSFSAEPHLRDGGGENGGTLEMMLGTMMAQLSEVMGRLDRQAVSLNAVMGKQAALDMSMRSSVDRTAGAHGSPSLGRDVRDDPPPDPPVMLTLPRAPVGGKDGNSLESESSVHMVMGPAGLTVARYRPS